MVHFEKYILDALAKPEFTKPSRRDSTVLIFYGLIKGKNRLRIAVVVKTNQKPFILTAYVTNKQ